MDDRYIVVLQLVTGQFVIGNYIEGNPDSESEQIESTDKVIVLESPITIRDAMTPQGMHGIPMPYGHPFLGLDLTKGRRVPFNRKHCMVGPIEAPESVRNLWIQMTSIVKPVENKIQIVS